jgi:flagella basal body P-ring formation protein FlgA
VHRTEPAGEDRRAGRECFALRQNLAEGSHVAGQDLLPVACRPGAQPPLPLRYDSAAGTPRSTAALPAGTYLGPLALRPEPVVEKGQKLTLAIAAGPVRIERTVEALQSSRSGRAIFVRTGDGQVVSAPLALVGTTAP